MSVRTRAMGTGPEESLKEGREGRCRTVRTLWATKEPTEEGRRRRPVVTGAATVVIVMTEASKASTATTASVSTTTVSAATGLVWDLLGRIIRSWPIPHGVRAVHIHLGPVLLLLVLLLALLALCYGSRDLIVCDVFGRERLVVGTLRGVGIRSTSVASPTGATARSMSSAPASKSVTMTMTAVGTRTPRVLAPVLPASRLSPALPELGTVESRLAGRTGGSAVDASAIIVPVEVSWPSHVAGLYLVVFRCDDMMYTTLVCNDGMIR